MDGEGLLGSRRTRCVRCVACVPRMYALSRCACGGRACVRLCACRTWCKRRGRTAVATHSGSPPVRRQAKRGQKAQVDFAPAVGGIGLKIENGATAREGRRRRGREGGGATPRRWMPFRGALRGHGLSPLRGVWRMRGRGRRRSSCARRTLRCLRQCAAAGACRRMPLPGAVCGRSDRGGQAEYPSV